MSAAEQFLAKPGDEVKRDRWGRPLVVPRGGGRVRGYTRASTLGSALEDSFGLTMWKQRMTAIGIASRRDLVLAANASRTDKDKLNGIVEQAMEAAQSGAAATIGTSMHSLAEMVDRGEDPGYIPDEFLPDLNAYRELTEPLFEHVAIEQFCVCDELEVAGTPDRVSRLRRPLTSPTGETIAAGEVLITDEKTSGSMDFGGIKFSVQLATYAHGEAYDTKTGARTPWPGPVRQDWALIVHCPSGAGTADLYWVNVAAGWELAQLAVHVREQRKRKDLVVLATVDEDFFATAASAASLDDLSAAAVRANRAGQWNEVLRAAFSRRKAQLLEGAVA